MVAGAGLVAPKNAIAQDATPASADESLLFVLSLTDGAVAPDPGGDGSSILTARDVAGHAVWFDDRPARRAGVLPTEDFLTLLEGAADDPPNAALVVDSDDGGAVAAVELGAGTYDASTRVLSVAVRPLPMVDGAAALPAAFAGAALFVDGLAGMDGPIVVSNFSGQDLEISINRTEREPARPEPTP